MEEETVKQELTPQQRSERLRLAPRAALLVLDATFVTALVGTCWLALETPALAYVDPSVMTYTIQALAGVAVALSAVLGVVWRRARRVVMRALHVDENAGKVVEPAVRGVEADDEAALEEATSQARVERMSQGVRRHRRLRWRERFALALAPAVSLAFGLLVVSPIEVVAGGTGSLSFTIANVWPPLAIAALALALALALVASAVRGRAFDIVLGGLAALAVAALVQQLAMNAGLPLADGSQVNWAEHADATLSSGIIWVAIIAVLCALGAARPVVLRSLAVVAAFVLVVSQGINLGLLVASAPSDRPVVTQEGLMDVSPKKNVVVFVLDTLDTTYMDDVLRDYPDDTNLLGGFTYFRNSTAAMIPTRYALPFLITGHGPEPDRPTFDTDEVKGWFDEHNLLDDIAARGYSVGIYTDSANFGLDGMAKKTLNVRPPKPYVADFASTVQALGTAGLYRSLPWALKPNFWFTTDQLNQAVTGNNELARIERPYQLNDPAYGEFLREHRLSADDQAPTGAYRLIHMMGSHVPLVMDENMKPANLPETHESLIRQSQGALEVVNEYLQQLKDLGVYDDTTVIITADHGRWPWTDPGSTPWDIEHLDRTTTPTILVKPAGADTSQPLVTSEAPTGHFDLPATIEQAVGATPEGPTVFDVPEGQSRPRDFYWIHHDGKYDHTLYEWEIDGDALDFNDWRETGRTWPIDMEGYRP